jgi:antitoxin (DNA-binding transcriptional repressor) of toxin-antitoxin stability system
MTVYTVHQAKSQLSRLLAEVAQGQEVIIARGKTPVARLSALAGVGRARAPGGLKGLAIVTDSFFEPLPADELAGWTCEGAEADD